MSYVANLKQEHQKIIINFSFLPLPKHDLFYL